MSASSVANKRPAVISRAAGRRYRAAGPGSTPASIPARAAKGLLLLIACAVVVMPFVAVVSTSLADDRQVSQAGGLVLWPERPSFDAYRAIFAGGVVSRALLCPSASRSSARCSASAAPPCWRTRCPGRAASAASRC
ncbi:hypothetical protein AB0M47_03965 [Hamadaea sp. NPDC051192]|uniref:hypothetical protein n=1 Tax=Hamadaea sp. NPDC051192 TaxID=3154940 RepID=UPI0034298A33